MNVVVRLLTAVLASLIGWIGFTGSAAAGSALTAPPATYTYDHPGNPGALNFGTTERGTPAMFDLTTAYDAFGRGSHDASARPDGATPPGPFTYDHACPLAQGASSAPGTTLSGVSADAGGLPALGRSQVAAKAVPNEGIYVIRNAADEVYVGQSGNITSRLGQHVSTGKGTAAPLGDRLG